MIYQNNRKILLIIYSIVLIVFESFFIIFLLYDYNLLAEFTGMFDVTYNSIWLLYLLFINFTVTITGLLFARDSLRSEHRRIRFKGKALILAFLTYPICGIIDGGLELDAIGVIIIRSILMFGAVMFYTGFFVPIVIKKILKL